MLVVSEICAGRYGAGRTRAGHPRGGRTGLWGDPRPVPPWLTRWATIYRRSAGLTRAVFAMTSLSAAFSSDRLAYMFLSRTFSCSSYFSRFMSEASSCIFGVRFVA
jgi:hypothetical protein